MYFSKKLCVFYNGTLLQSVLLEEKESSPSKAESKYKQQRRNNRADRSFSIFNKVEVPFFLIIATDITRGIP